MLVLCALIVSVWLVVRERRGADLVCECASAGAVRSHAGLNAPAEKLSLPPITAADRSGLAEALAGATNIEINVARVHTNIVMIDLTRGTSASLVELAREEGVLIGVNGPQRVRAVTHLDVDRDGVLRAHRKRPDGSIRDTVVYSITAAEWRDVRRLLESKLSRG